MRTLNFQFILENGFGISCEAPGMLLDLHNNANFQGFEYSAENAKLLLKWFIRDPSIIPNHPTFVSFSFHDVGYLEVRARDNTMPLDEDQRLNTISCIETTEALDPYLHSGLIPTAEAGIQNSTVHIVFRFNGGQFIRVGAESVELLFSNDTKYYAV